MASIFGALVTEADVRMAARATVELWLPTYTSEVARQKGIHLDPVRAYGTGAGPDYPDDDLPAAVIVAPGMAGSPEPRGDGSIDAPWSLGIGFVVAHPDRDEAILRAGAYTAAGRALILQNGSLGGFATETTWLDEEVTVISMDPDRVVAAGSVQFRVLVPQMVDRRAGMASPPVDPFVPSSTAPVTGTSAGLVKVPITTPLD